MLRRNAIEDSGVIRLEYTSTRLVAHTGFPELPAKAQYFAENNR